MSHQDLHKSKGRHVRMPSSYGLTLQQKNILPAGLTQPCPHARLQSLAIVLIHFQLCKAPLQQLSSHTRGMLLFQSEALSLHSIWHPLTHTKEDVFCASTPCANGACHQGPGFLHTSRVCNLALLSPESAWSICPHLLQLASKMEESTTTKHDPVTAATMA